MAKLTAKEIQDALLSCWYGDPDDLFNTLDGTEASSYEEAGILTNNKGIIIRTQTGEEFQITIIQSR